jgi:general secretion pathway protein F
MPTFSYTAKTVDGQTVNGVLAAESQGAALRTLDERALFPVSVREGGAVSGRGLLGQPRRVSLRRLAAFYSQLADLLGAGVPLLRALDVLARQKGRSALIEVIKELREDVAGGESLADAMQKHPRIFKDLHVSMIAAGERGGFLEDVLSRIGTFIERQDELRNKLLGSMIYPCILLLGGTAVVTFMMSFIVPKIRPLLERSGNLPALTIGLFGFCDFFRNNWLLFVVLLAVALGGAWTYLRTPRGRRAWNRFVLRAPIVGSIITMVSICRFCRIFGTMLQNGVPILQSLRVSKDSAGNRILGEAIEQAADSVREGETLAGPLGVSGLFPPDILDMIAVSEESNTLEKVLVQIADTNEARTARKIDLGVRLVEPILLVIIAGIVLVIALALLVPILTSSTGRL